VSKKQTFAFRPGFHAGDLDPEAVAGELDRIKQRNDGVVEPETVVAEAADPESPLHAGFVWDDTEAARLHRLQQARSLIRSVIIIHNNQPPRNVYVHVRKSEETRGGYFPASVVVQTPSLYDRAVDELRGKLAGASRSLKELMDLAESANRPKRQAVAKVNRHLEAAVGAAEGLR